MDIREAQSRLAAMPERFKDVMLSSYSARLLPSLLAPDTR